MNETNFLDPELDKQIDQIIDEMMEKGAKDKDILEYLEGVT